MSDPTFSKLSETVRITVRRTVRRTVRSLMVKSCLSLGSDNKGYPVPYFFFGFSMKQIVAFKSHLSALHPNNSLISKSFRLGSCRMYKSVLFHVQRGLQLNCKAAPVVGKISGDFSASMFGK
jgi:hypothetical protein